MKELRLEEKGWVKRTRFGVHSGQVAGIFSNLGEKETKDKMIHELPRHQCTNRVNIPYWYLFRLVD